MNANATALGPDFELDWPANDVTRVPYKVYTDKSIYDREQELLFQGPLWHFLGLEVEIPKADDFKTTFIGETPVVVTRNAQGEIHGWVNRCAHRGSLVCREHRGNQKSHSCVYHQWNYDHEGNLNGVPFRRGVGGRGGYPKDFAPKNHGLKKVRIETCNGLVFGTLSKETPALQAFLGPKICAMFDRVCGKPLKLLGYHRQYVRGNWKLYHENTRDPYHASLLHLFHATFGLIRTSQDGVSEIDGLNEWHSIVAVKGGTDGDRIDEYKTGGLRTFRPEGFQLQDPSVLMGRKEFDDPVSLVIMGVFPSLVMHQISNTLCMRQVLPKANDQTELIWHFFGYADDDVEMDKIRLKQMNLVGPGGLISMEDGEAIELVQRAIGQEGNETAVLEMGGRDLGGADHLVTEAGIRSMWHGYRKAMNI